MDLVERARKYLSRMEPAVSGSHGHSALLAAAGVLVNGFDFEDGLAYQLLWEEFNPRCQPPWSERDVKRKVEQARKLGGNSPRGHLIGENRGGENPQRSARRSHAPEERRLDKRQAYDPEALKRMMMRGFTPSVKWLAERSPIEVADVSPQRFLDTILKPGEATLVFYNFYSQGEFGHVAGGKTFRLGKRPGQPKASAEGFPQSGREGAWYLPCPLDGKWHPTGKVDEGGNPVLSRRSGTSIVEYRYMLLESDKAEPEQWLNFLCQLPLPVSALYSSAGKSIHALIKVEAVSKSRFDAFRDRASALLSKLGTDPAAMTGLRLTRLPGILREGTTDSDGRYHRFDTPRLQRLLYLNPEPEMNPLVTMPLLRRIDTAS